MGPRIPQNAYSHGQGYEFSNKFVYSRKLAQAASAGKYHKDTVAFAAQLAREDKIKLIGDGHGFKCGPKYFAEAYNNAQLFEAANPGVVQPNYKTVEELLADPGDVFYIDGLAGDKKSRYDKRIEKYDKEYYLSKWVFPDIPAGTTDLMANRAARIEEEKRQQEEEEEKRRAHHRDVSDSDGESVINWSDNDIEDNIQIDQFVQRLVDFKTSSFVSQKDDPAHKASYLVREKLVKKARKLLVKNAGRSAYNTWKAANPNKQSSEFIWSYSMCKDKFNVWNTRMVYYLLLFRVYHALKPAHNKFKMFFDENITDRKLEEKITDLYLDVYKYVVKKGRIKSSDGERIQSFGDMDVLKNEIENLFKYERNKVMEKKKVHCGRRTRDEFEPLEDGWDALRRRGRVANKRRRIESISTPSETTNNAMHNEIVNMIQSSHNSLRDEFRVSQGMSVDDTVDEMISNPKRGLRHYSHEYKSYHLTKDDVYGFQLIAEELATKDIGGGDRNTYFQRLVNVRPGKRNRRQQLNDLQGKFGSAPSTFTSRVLLRRCTVIKIVYFDEDIWALTFVNHSLPDNQWVWSLVSLGIGC